MTTDWDGAGFEPPTFRSLDDPLYLLGHCSISFVLLVLNKLLLLDFKNTVVVVFLTNVKIKNPSKYYTLDL